MSSGSHVHATATAHIHLLRHARTALVALCAGTGLLTLVAAAALVGAPVAEAASCGGATVTATPMHSPDGTARPFYAEFRSGSTKHSGYVGYELDDPAGDLGSDVWVRLSGFAGGSLALAAGQSDSVPVRATSASGKRLAYVYLTASAETATAQTFTVEIWNGKPGLAGSAQVCTGSDGFSGVFDVLDAAANKITSVSVSTSTPAIGGTVSVTAVGDTGTMGAGDASDKVGANGVFSMSPSMEDAWPADSFTLTGVQVALGGTTYRDRLRIYPGTAAAGAYTAVYTFTVRKGTSGPTPVRPVQNIASGTQVKYTGSYSGTLQDIAEPLLTTTLVKSPAGLTGPPYAITYEVVASNASGGPVVLDYLRDTPTPVSAWSFVAGSASLDGSAIADPANDAGTLVFQGPFSIPGRSGSTDGTLTFRYTLNVTATVANSVVGTVGDVSIGGSSGSTDNEVTVNPAAPAITTGDVPDGIEGSAYSTTLAATGGETPYTWAVSAGSLPAGLSLAAATGAVTGTPTVPGTFAFTIRVTDDVAQSSTRSFSATIVAPDTTAPAGASLEIDAGATATASTGTTLSLAATDAAGVTAYRVANGTDCSAAAWVTVTTAVSFSGTAPFTLAGGDGARTVCAQYRDAAGNLSATATDTIALDATAPTGTVTLAGGAPFTTSTAVSMALTATDAVGVTDYRAALGTDCSAAPWTAVAATLSLSTTVAVTLSGADGAASVCAEFRDALGNVSATAAAAITLDTSAPAATLSSSAAAAGATSPIAVTLAFSEDVVGLSAADLVVGNGSVSGLAGSGAVYTFDVTPLAAGVVTVDVAAAAAADLAGNPSTAAAQLTRTYDTAVPTPVPVPAPPVLTIPVVPTVIAAPTAPVVGAAPRAAAASSVTLDLTVDTGRPYNQVRRGELFAATATLWNVGGQRADGVRLTLRLPAGVVLAGGAPAGCTVRANVLSCSLGALAPNARRVVLVELRATSGGPLALRAVAASATQRRLTAGLAVRAPTGRRCTIYGTTPLVRGTPGDDVICLSPGYHLVLAGTGDDIVYGRSGRQVIYGGAGSDLLYGAADRDYLDGGPGDDVLEGGDGADKLLGRAGADRLRGGPGRDRLHGGRDVDVALSGAGDLVFEVEAGDAGWRTGVAGGVQLIVKRGP